MSGDPEAWYLLGVAALEGDRINEGVYALMHAVELAPQDSERALAAAKELVGAGCPAEAERILRGVLAQSPDRADVREALVRLLIDNGRGRVALEELTRALKADPEDIGLRLLAATAHERLGESDHAVRQLSFVTAQDPGHLEANRRLGPLLADRGDVAGAIYCWRQVVAQAGSEDLEALTMLGMQLSHAGEHVEALRILYDVAARQPEDAAAHANLGMALVASGKIHEAVRAFRRTVELDAAWPRWSALPAIAAAGSGRRVRVAVNG